MAARDSDYAAFTWYPALPALEEWMTLYQKLARANGGEPDAGRRLLSWARAAGFTRSPPPRRTWCFATPEDRAWWGGMWAERILGSAMAEQALAPAPPPRTTCGASHGDGGSGPRAATAGSSILHGEILCRT